MSDHPHCHNLLASISDYIDDTLRAELCADLEEHLKECENCRIVVDTLRKTIEVYQVNAVVENMPADVRSRLFYRLELDAASPTDLPAARPGELCPRCQQGVMDYDGTLTLKCPSCGYSQAGCST